MKMKKVYENGYISVSETGNDFDFVAVIQNETNKKLTLDFYDLEKIELEPYGCENDWCGLTNTEYYCTMERPDYSYMVAIENGDYDVIESEV